MIHIYYYDHSTWEGEAVEFSNSPDIPILFLVVFLDETRRINLSGAGNYGVLDSGKFFKVASCSEYESHMDLWEINKQTRKEKHFRFEDFDIPSSFTRRRGGWVSDKDFEKAITEVNTWLSA